MWFIAEINSTLDYFLYYITSDFSESFLTSFSTHYAFLFYVSPIYFSCSIKSSILSSFLTHQISTLEAYFLLHLAGCSPGQF